MLTPELLAEYAWDVAQNGGQRVVTILRAQGKEIEQMDRCYIVRSNGFTCGLPLGGSPVDALNNVLFALFGPLWPLMGGDEYTKAQRLIATELKRQRSKRQPKLQPVICLSQPKTETPRLRRYDTSEQLEFPFVNQEVRA